MNTSNFTLLVVDDDQDDLEIFYEAIQSINSAINCLVADNGKAALDLLNQLIFLPQIIFLDYNMPQMNGQKCLNHIRNIERLKNIPVVMYSTSFSAQLGSELKQAGAYLIQKQTEFKEVVKSILTALKHFYPDFQAS
jgi:CheY-like chemotaxis protein